jgi:hypothetical protein
MADQLFWGDALDEVGTTQLHELGTERVEHNNTYGERIWRYVKNDEASTAFAVGTIVRCKADTLSGGTGIVAVTAALPAAGLLGVAQHAIAAGSYGWVLFRGVGNVLGDGTIAKNAYVVTNGTAGKGKVGTIAADSAAAMAWSFEDDSADGDTVVARIVIP